MTTPVAQRPLGRSGLTTAPLVFGGNVFGWTVDEASSFALLDQFIAAGFNCIDTADVYSAFAPGNVGGESETVIGRWLANGAPREKVLIAAVVTPSPDFFSQFVFMVPMLLLYGVSIGVAWVFRRRETA